MTTTYTCDIGGETTTDPAGWMLFQLSGMPVSMANPMDNEPFRAPDMLACPNHVQHVVNVITAGLSAIAPVPGSKIPGKPTSATATEADGVVTVTWKEPSSDGGSPVTGYVIRSVPGDVVARPAAVTTAEVTGLTPGISYAFTVAAINAVGEGPTSAQSAAIDMPEPAPA